jgi:hypothetical protein
LRRRKTATPYRVVIYRCRECGRSELVTPAGRHPVDGATAEAVIENAAIHDAGRRHHAIPPAVRHEVLDRDGHRCRAPGCGSTRFLELHHVVPRARGGTHRAANLITLCSRCHRFLHRRPSPVQPSAGTVDGGAPPPFLGTISGGSP